MSGQRPRMQARPKAEAQARPRAAAQVRSGGPGQRSGGPGPRSGGPAPRRPLAGLVAVAIVIGAAALGMIGLSGLVGDSTRSSPAAATGARSSPSIMPATAPASARTSPDPTPTPSVSPDPSPSPTSGAAGGLVAPTSAKGFDLRKTAIDIAFPFLATTRYRYSDPFLAPRVGVTRRYNHARGVSAGGRLLRAHDGLDLRAKRGTRVHAAFSGTVIDPATRWKPWAPELYGKFVVIVSDEVTSPGYAVIYAHLASARVKVGDRVKRGQWIGRVGNTGNAAAEPPQLHFELRAPFKIPVREGGRDRRIDAFDPLPSLVAADPKRQQ